MHDPDEWVVEFSYRDSEGNVTRRVVSPIRFLSSKRFLALCLGRAAPRQFYLERCEDLQVRKSIDFVMPVPI